MATALVCKGWAALHLDDGSKIWEAANLPTAAMQALESGTSSKSCKSLGMWLSRRAPGLRQLQPKEPASSNACIRTVPDEVSPGRRCIRSTSLRCASRSLSVVEACVRRTF